MDHRPPLTATNLGSGAAPRHESAKSTPLYKFSFSSVSNILSSVCQYEALKYVSFPTQVLSKSCKMVPVMLMGYAVSRRVHTTFEYLVAMNLGWSKRSSMG